MWGVGCGELAERVTPNIWGFPKIGGALCGGSRSKESYYLWVYDRGPLFS